MVVRRFTTQFIAFSAITLSMASSVYAGVKCPSADEVKDAATALNTVMRQGEKTFFVLTAQPAISSSNLDWIVAAQASGRGFDAAFSNGEGSVKSVLSAVTDEAMEQQGAYLCAYLSMGGMNVMTIAPQQQKISFNPAFMNLDAFKQSK